MKLPHCVCLCCRRQTPELRFNNREFERTIPKADSKGKSGRATPSREKHQDEAPPTARNFQIARLAGDARIQCFPFAPFFSSLR